MQLGFVIDHSRCIGCHACTVACKAENDVPLGSFRTWVKYTEKGEYPEVRRHFAVLRCNQCTDAPCVTICPVRALEKRPDGIVDVDPAACIGCKACMQGCPYDALYIHPRKGTAEKCHFCAHRVEAGLAPACAIVCPTEAIVPGDFHDPESVVSRMKADGELSARKREAGTGPNVFYKEADPGGLDPTKTEVSGDWLWANRLDGAALEAEAFLAEQAAERASRTTYDVDHPAWWGWKVSAYLFTKSLAAGLFLVQAVLLWGTLEQQIHRKGAALTWASLFFLGVTALLLVADLKRPERFLYILFRPNPRSWLVRGSWVLTGFGLMALVWWAVLRFGTARTGMGVPTYLLGAVGAALTAGYTGWLFGQAKGRVLWMRRGLAAHLIAQAFVAGFAATRLLAGPIGLEAPALAGIRSGLLVSLAVHLFFLVTEGQMAPVGREAEYERAVSLVESGPWAGRRIGLGIVVGVVVPALLLVLPLPANVELTAAALALIGLASEEDLMVRAGQALPIS